MQITKNIPFDRLFPSAVYLWCFGFLPRYAMKGPAMRLNACLHASLLSLCLALSFATLNSRADTEGDYTYIVTDGQATITGFNVSYSGALSITNTLGGCPVASIGGNAFFWCKDLISVTIPDSVTSIGGTAFSDCYSLASVTIPGSVNSIGNEAFYYCCSLTNLVIGTGVTTIGDSAFLGCVGLINLVIGSNVTSLGSAAFSWCTGLTSVTIPGSVTNMGDYTFSHCSSLTSVNISPGVTAIGGSAFYKCTGLTKLVIGTGVTTIGQCAFDNCSGLTSVTIPASVTSIGNAAFTSCSGLTNVVIGTGVTTIGDGAFLDCNGLTSVTIPDNVKTIGDRAFGSCSKLACVFFTGDVPTNLVSSAFLITPATLYYLPTFASNWPSILAGRPTRLWNPTVQRDAAFGFSSNRFGFNIAGSTNIPVKVEATTNLMSGTWTPITNATLGTSGSLYFNDPSSTNKPARFYRIAFP